MQVSWQSSRHSIWQHRWGRIRSLAWNHLRWEDVACVLFLLAAFWYLAGEDGGKPLRALTPVLVLALPVLAAGLREVERSSQFIRWMTAWWALGPLLALATAEVRAGWVAPVAVLSLAPPAFLATRHLFRRRYGPTAIAAILLLGGLRAWWEAFLAFWGGGGGNHWLALSWHNQSATLMGALAILGFALAVGGRGWARTLGLLVAALGGGATWLAASRAGLATAVLGLAVSGGVAARLTSVRKTVLALIGVLALSWISVAAMDGLASAPGTGAERLTERGLDRGNLYVRFDYWQGAWGMLAEAPLTGTGPGSYGWSSLPHDSFGTSRVQSAHNEYLEVLAGQGLLGGLPVWIVTFVGAWLVLLSLVGKRVTQGSRGCIALIAAAGVLAHLGVHAGFDFDWDYPILLLAGAVALAALAPIQTSGPPADNVSVRGHRPGWEMFVVLACVAPVALSLWGIFVETSGDRAPWSLDNHLHAAWSAVQESDVQGAETILTKVQRWNPGAPRLPASRAVVDHVAGRMDTGDLAVYGLSSPSMDERLNVLQHLVESHELEYAGTVRDELRPFIEERRRWQVRSRVARLAWISLGLAFQGEGCAGLEPQWQVERDWAARFGMEVDDLLDRPPSGDGAALQCEEHPLHSRS